MWVGFGLSGSGHGTSENSVGLSAPHRWMVQKYSGVRDRHRCVVEIQVCHADSLRCAVQTLHTVSGVQGFGQ